jgi:hypothetical protein
MASAMSLRKRNAIKTLLFVPLGRPAVFVMPPSYSDTLYQARKSLRCAIQIYILAASYMADSVQKNFRISSRTVKLLHEVARLLDITETEVVETCVAKFALEIGKDVERAKEVLYEQICRAAAKAPLQHSRTEESLHLNEGEGRGGSRETSKAPVEHSAAGTLAMTAGEGWGSKKAKGKA